MEPLEIEVFSPASSPRRSPSRHVEKHHGSLSTAKCRQKRLHLFDFESVGYALPLCGDVHARSFRRTSDGVPVNELPPDCMVENTAHRVPNLLSRTAGKRFGLAELRSDDWFQPLLNRNGFDGSELNFSPLRQNPPVSKIFLLRVE